MAKDQNTFAKRQREMEKKRKADEKRERRAKRKNKVDESSGASKLQYALSPAEQSVLTIFRNYLMLPEKMLCLDTEDTETFKLPLAQLVSEGMLIAEQYQGGYSLTAVGFAAMQDGE